MVEQLVVKLKEYNAAYRVGKPLVPDSQYDILVDELYQLDPNNEFFGSVGHEIQDESRKKKLPIIMASMNKCKTIEEIKDWIRLKNIPQDEEVIITPKFDGLSLCVNEETNEATTRGDGDIGQCSDEHYKHIKNKLYDILEDFDTFSPLHFKYTFGEVMMPKQKFIDDYSNDFANPRNLVAGLLNSKTVDSSLITSLSDCNYIKYGAVINDKSKSTYTTKKEVLNELNFGQKEKVDYHLCKVSDLTEDLLIRCFHTLSPNYEIDGVIIELNNLSLQEKLGRETSSGNPVWARAFKHASFEQTAETEVLGISWNISKQGLIKPIVHIRPVRLDGVTVSNVTGNNARFVKDMGIGVGAIVKVKRSGMVIPIITDVISPVDFEMPNIPNIDWNENGIELITLFETDEQKFKQLVSFFEILEADNVGEGVIQQLWDTGYQTVGDIISLDKSDLEKIDRFGKRKAEIVYNSIKKSTTNVSLSKLQHATGIFKGLGSRKLVLLEHFDTKPTVDDILKIEGFAEISAKSYLEGYDKFFEFIKDLPISIQEKVEAVNVGGDLEGMTFVFTGVRRVDLEGVIESRGGKIGSSVSKNTTHLVMRAVGSGSSKEQKAIDLGLIIITVEQLEKLLK